MATSSPVVETVSRKRVVPPAELAAEKPARSTPDFWEFIEKMTPEMWGNDFTLYILREDPKPSLYGGTNTLEKCPGYIAMPDGTKQPLSSREDIELAIKQKYGGKAFRLILKRANGERICEGKCVNEAPPRFPDANPQSFQHPLPNGGMQSSDNVAVKAMETVANQNPQLINIAIDAVSRAADIVARAQGPGAAHVKESLDDEIDRELRRAMLRKFLEPPPAPPDPVETFLRIRTALGDGGSGASLAGNPVMDRILNAAVEKILNPAPAVSGRTTLLDLGREFIPVLGTTVRETMHEYRLSQEANVRMMELQRGAVPPGANPQPVHVQQLPQPVPVPQAQPGQNPPAEAAPAAVPATALTFPQIEAHIAKIVSNVEYPVEEAVDRVLSFLYDTDGRLVAALLDPPSIDQRLKPGKEGLLQLFTYEPALNVCMRNVPRVSDFIDKFLIAAKEAEEMEAKLRAAAPAATTAPPTPAS